MTLTSDTPETKASWSPLWVGLAIFIFPPFGIYLLWTHPLLGKNNKWWIGACCWGVLWLISLGRNPPPDGDEVSESSLSQADSQPRGNEISASQSSETQRESQPNRNEISATDLLSLAGNASRVRKRFPGRFVVTGKVLKVEDHNGAWGRKTYSVDLIGTYNSKGLVDSWVICEMSKDAGLEDISTGQHVEIEGEFDRASGRDFVWMKKCWLK